MSYGASFPHDQGPKGTKKPSKTALKAAIAADPTTVHLHDTVWEQSWSKWLGGFANEIPSGVKVDVVGPDVYNDRRWYATIERKPDGTLKVS